MDNLLKHKVRQWIMDNLKVSSVPHDYTTFYMKDKVTNSVGCFLTDQEFCECLELSGYELKREPKQTFVFAKIRRARLIKEDK
jgi:hypothetical protein